MGGRTGSGRPELPVGPIPEDDPLGFEGLIVAVQVFAAVSVGGVLAKAARDTGLRWWWLNLPIVALIGTAGSFFGMGGARLIEIIAERLRKDAARARFWVRYGVVFLADVVLFQLMAPALEGRSLWRGSWRWSWMIGWPLAALMLSANALGSEARGRVAAARGMMLHPITELRNRRTFDGDLALVVRAHVGFTFVFADLDRLKQLNDTSGHAAGNAAIRALAAALDRHGHAYHWGGDEFALLVAGTDRDALIQIARSVAAELQRAGTPVGLSFSASLGAAFVPAGDARGPEGIQHDADVALYAAKHAGRGRLAIAGESGDIPLMPHA